VIDAHMPEVDGFALADAIRRAPGLTCPVLIMLTSGDRPDDLSRCTHLGIAAYLLKPVKQSELRKHIENALGGTDGPKPAWEPPTSTPAAVRGPLRILLAEDSAFNQKLAVAVLTKAGHTVVVARHGIEVLAAWRSQPFDLVLMDVQMPEMDGLEATRLIRAEEVPTGRRTPIIAMTAHALKGDRERCLEAGMDGYISKPIRVRELDQTIDSVLQSLR